MWSRRTHPELLHLQGGMENYGAVGVAGATTVMLHASSYENLGGPAHLGILLFTILHHHHMTTQSNQTTHQGLG